MTLDTLITRIESLEGPDRQKLREALWQYESDLRHPVTAPDSIERRISMIRDALKILGEN